MTGERSLRTGSAAELPSFLREAHGPRVANPSEIWHGRTARVRDATAHRRAPFAAFLTRSNLRLRPLALQGSTGACLSPLSAAHHDVVSQTELLSHCLCRGSTPPHGAGDDIILDNNNSSGGGGGHRSVDSSALTATLTPWLDLRVVTV